MLKVATAIDYGLGFVRFVYVQSFVLPTSRMPYVAVSFIVYVCTSMHRCVCLQVHVFEFQFGSQQR